MNNQIEWTFEIRYWIEYWIESFLGPIQRLIESSKSIEHPYILMDLSVESNFWFDSLPVLYEFITLLCVDIKIPICCLATCVSAFVEIHQSLQCKIFQYTFLGQYPMKFWDLFSLCKIQQSAWLQLDHKKLRSSEMRFSDPHIMKLKKHALVWDILFWKNID